MKTTTNTLTLTLPQPYRPLPESWHRVALDIIRSKVRPVLRNLAVNQSVTVAGDRAKSPRLEVKRLPAKAAPWRVRVVMNTQTVMYVARRALRIVHGDDVYEATI